MESFRDGKGLPVDAQVFHEDKASLKSESSVLVSTPARLEILFMSRGVK